MARTRAYFLVQGDALDPDSVSAKLHLLPDATARRGELCDTHDSKRKIEARTSYWQKDCPIEDELELQKYVEWLKDLLLGKEDAVASLSGQNVVILRVAVSVEPDKSLPGCFLEPDIMGFLSLCRVHFEIDQN